MSIAIKKSHQGHLHKNLGVPAGKKIPAGRLAEALNSESETVREQAQFAQNAKSWKHCV